MLHAPFGKRIQFLPAATGLQRFSTLIDTDRMLLFHTVVIVLNQLIGSGYDMRAGTVIFHQIVLTGLIIIFELLDKTDVGAAKLVNILIIVAYRQNSQLVFFILRSAASTRD